MKVFFEKFIKLKMFMWGEKKNYKTIKLYLFLIISIITLKFLIKNKYLLKLLSF